MADFTYLPQAFPCKIYSRCVALSIQSLAPLGKSRLLFEALGKDNIPPFQAPSQAAPVPGCVSCKTAIAVIASPPA